MSTQPFSPNHGYSSSYEEIQPPLETNESSSIIENYKIKIMEKDKSLFELGRTLKQQEKIIDSLQHEIESKTEHNENLQHQIEKLSFYIHQYETVLNQNQSELKELKVHSDLQITSLNEQRISLLKRIEELEKVLTNTSDNFKTSYKEYQQLEQDNSSLKETINNKQAIISKYEGIFDQLKQDNKQIPSLKRRISDLEDIIEQYKNEINTLKANNEKIQCDKYTIQKKLINEINENQKEKIKMDNLYQLNNEIETLKKDNTEKDNENTSLTEKYNSIIKDSDIFVRVVSYEIEQFLNYIENLNKNKSTTMKFKLPSTENYNSTELNNTFNLKYDIIMKSFNLLKGNLIKLLNSYSNNLNKLSTSLSDKENIIKENEKLKHNLNEEKQQIHNMQKTLDTVNNHYIQLKGKYNKLKNSYQNFMDKNDNIAKETKKFLQGLQLKLNNNKGEYNFSEINSNDIITSNKIIEKINSITNENTQLLQELNGIQNTTNAQTMGKVYESKKIGNQITIFTQKTNENFNQDKHNEIYKLKQQNDTLYDKIKELTKLLDESNQLISAYEKEVKKLKNKNAQLEYNLQTLNTRIELEQSLNINKLSVQNEKESNVRNNNNLLSELELKNNHIKSLEKILKSNNIQVENNEKDKNSNIENDKKEDNKNNVSQHESQYVPSEKANEFNTSSFIKNEEHEKELQKLMNCFGNIHKYNKNNNEYNHNNIIQTEQMSEESNPILNSNIDNKRIPGKLYSTRKK